MTLRAALVTASHQRLEGLERFAGRGQALHFRRKLPASCLGARASFFLSKAAPGCGVL